ncbi:MAG: YifB family Mg chelatase-like AAA ATPase [Eubacteriales bacterium]|nr:YifB family Mg chelatase-like AAA ATPase [Eubacteriales bacterium]
MVAEVVSGMVHGIQGELITVQTDISDGLPVFSMIGHLSPETKEARERVRTALKNTGFHLPPRRISVNLSPAEMRKNGTCCDLAIAIGLFTAMGMLPPEASRGILFLGELALDGTLSPLAGVLPILKAASEAGYRRCVLPAKNKREASILPEMEVWGFHCLKDVFSYLSGNSGAVCEEEDDVDSIISEEEREIGLPSDRIPDLSEVRGQHMAKRAIEIAVAGFHNLFLDGPPGSGKSMLASCVPGLMPDMSREEMIETTMIYSVKGLLQSGVPYVKKRPYRAPSTSVTPVGLFGGGRTPKPGEASLAHHGVLFLDEFPEFKKEVVEMFRVPLEEHKITQIRNGRTMVFPADFIFIAAANPCPCGYYPDRRHCSCTWKQIAGYQGKVSGPILDRLDLFVRCDKLSYHALTGEKEGETSAEVKKRIQRVWEIQERRFCDSPVRFNGRMGQREVQKFCTLDEESRHFMEEAFDRFRLTGRSYHRMLKTSRTIADLEGEEKVHLRHLKEALLYRRMVPMSQVPR